MLCLWNSHGVMHMEVKGMCNDIIVYLVIFRGIDLESLHLNASDVITHLSIHYKGREFELVYVPN